MEIKGKGRKSGAITKRERASDYSDFQSLYESRDLFRQAGAKSVSCCGLGAPTGSASIVREWKDGKAKARKTGTHRCKNARLCPVCAPAISVSRVNDLQPQFQRLVAKGWTFHLQTLTVQHTVEDSVAAVLGLLSKSWARMTKGKSFDEFRKRVGGLAYVRGDDQTFSRRSGCHGHFHVVVGFGPEAGDGVEAAEELLDRWRKAVDFHGGKVLRKALDSQPAKNAAAAAAYATAIAGVSKKTDRAAPTLDKKAFQAAQEVGFSTIAEATAAAAKRGRSHGGYTIADLREMAIAGDTWAYRMFVEYVRATKGKRTVVVSQNLRLLEEQEALDKAEEVVDPEVVADLRNKGLVAIDRCIARVLSAAASSAKEGREVLTQVLGPPGRDGLWNLPATAEERVAYLGSKAERVEKFGPLGQNAAALVRHLEAEAKARRAEAKAERAAMKQRKANRKQRREGAPK